MRLSNTLHCITKCVLAGCWTACILVNQQFHMVSFVIHVAPAFFPRFVSPSPSYLILRWWRPQAKSMRHLNLLQIRHSQSLPLRPGGESFLPSSPKRSHLGKKGHRSAHVSGTPLLFATSWSLKLHVKASSQNKNPWHNTHRSWRRFNSLRFREMSPSRLMIAGLNFQENKETNV